MGYLSSKGLRVEALNLHKPVAEAVAPKVEAISKVEAAPKAEAPKVEAISKVEAAPKAEAPKVGTIPAVEASPKAEAPVVADTPIPAAPLYTPAAVKNPSPRKTQASLLPREAEDRGAFVTSLDPAMMQSLERSAEVCIDFETTALTPWVAPITPGKSVKIGGTTTLHAYKTAHNCGADYRPRARVLSIGTALGAWAVDLDALSDVERSELILSAIQEKVVVGHNLQFDLSWASQLAPARPARILDTMLILRTYFPQAEAVLRSRAYNMRVSDAGYDELMSMIKSADSVAKKEDRQGSGFGSLVALCLLCKVPVPDKSYQMPVNWGVEVLSKGHHDYCISDATLPLLLLRRLVGLIACSAQKTIAPTDLSVFDNMPLEEVFAALDNHKSYPAYATLEQAIPRLIQMQNKGVKIGLESAEKYRDDKLSQATELYDEKLAPVLPPELKDDVLSAGQSDAIKVELNKIVGNKLPRTATGALSLSEGALKMSGLLENPILGAYHECKKLIGLGEKVLDFAKTTAADGRIHPMIAINTVTLRTSSKSPNLQGVPRDPAVRQLFVPSDGNKMLSIDYSAVELRIAAALAHRNAVWVRKILDNYTGGPEHGLGWLIPTINHMRKHLPEKNPSDPIALAKTDKEVMDGLEVDAQTSINRWKTWYAYRIASRLVELEKRGFGQNKKGVTGLYLLDAFVAKVDPHLATGLYLLSVKGEFDFQGKSPIEYLSSCSEKEQGALKKEYKDARQMAKSLNFGLLYGMGASTLYLYGVQNYGLQWTEDEATQAWHLWHSLYPEIGLWQDFTKLYNRWLGEDFATKKHTFIISKKSGNKENSSITSGHDQKVYRGYTLSGRAVISHEIQQALNYQDQGSGAEIALSAIAKLPEKIAEYLVLFVHDELIFDVPAEEAVEVQATVERVMMEAADRLLKRWGVPCESEGAIGDFWIH